MEFCVYSMAVEKSRPERRSMRFDEVSMERSQSFVTALQVNFVRSDLFLRFIRDFEIRSGMVCVMHARLFVFFTG